MTEAERLKLLQAAIAELKLTTQGHVQWVEEGRKGGHWKAAMASLRKLEADLKPDPVPALGPVWVDGTSLLLQDLTHATDGIPLYPALDDAFSTGRKIIAPESLTIISPYTSANPGAAFYAQGASRIRYWFGHTTSSPAIGRKFVKGEIMSAVAYQPAGKSHVHVGVNIEFLAGKGKQLIHHTDYSHGAPLIGTQLRRLLA